MEIEIKKYVLEQLNGQCIRRKRIDVLEFELETLMSQADEKAREVIEAMAFSHGDGEHVQTSDISDITADIAMSYRSAITDQARELYAWIRKLEIESERLDKYMGLLNREEATILRMHHFEGVRLESYCKKMSHECAHYDARAGNGLSYVGRVLFESSGMRYYIH